MPQEPQENVDLEAILQTNIDGNEKLNEVSVNTEAQLSQQMETNKKLEEVTDAVDVQTEILHKGMASMTPSMEAMGKAMTFAATLMEKLEGPTGPEGKQGPKGDKGDTGPKGEDAHKVGPKGDAGKDGVDGKDGRDGKDGKQGPMGLTGPKGDAGKDGVDGKDGKEVQVDKIIAKLKKEAERVLDDGIADINRRVTSKSYAMNDLTDTQTAETGEVMVKQADGSWEPSTPASSGDVVGPASATDNAIARFDGATGKLLQNSTVTVGDTGAIATTIANTSNVVGLTVTQNDTTNNPVGVEIVNAGTSASISVDPNGTTATGTGAIYVTNTGNDRSGLYVYSNNAVSTSGNGLVQVVNDNVGSLQPSLSIQQDGAANAVQIDQNANNKGLNVDKDVTNTNNTTVAAQIDHTSVVNDAGTYTKTGAALQINSTVTETSGTITDSAQVLDINQTHADATGDVVNIQDDGAGRALNVIKNKATGNALRVADASTFAFTGTGDNSVAWFLMANASDTGTLISARNQGSGTTAEILNNNTTSIGKGLFVDHNGTTGIGVDIDRDGNSASAITGLWVNTANAGAGAAYAAIFEAGSVGIGTTTPAEALSVTGNIAVSANLELGHASDTTLSRASAGILAVEGVAQVNLSTAQALTNKDLTATSNTFTAASTTQSGVAEASIASEVNTGTDAARYVSPDSLAGSNFGIRYVQAALNGTTALTTSEKVYFRIPAALTGMNLVSVAGTVGTGAAGSSSSGTPTFTVKNVTDNNQMLSTSLTIDANEYTSATAATPAVINASFDDVVTDDLIEVAVTTAGTGVTYATVTLGFQLP